MQQKSPREGSQGLWPHSAPHPKVQPSGRGHQPPERRFQGEPHRRYSDHLILACVECRVKRLKSRSSHDSRSHFAPVWISSGHPTIMQVPQGHPALTALVVDQNSGLYYSLLTMAWTVVLKESVIDDLRWFGRKDGRLYFFRSCSRVCFRCKSRSFMSSMTARAFSPT